MLDKLYEEISLRKETPKEGSYTNYLFDKGLDKILKKVGEETTEVVIAAKNNDQELISEVTDLTYHLLVLLVEKNIPLSAIQAELEGRAGKLSTTRDRKKIDKL
ncbi:phosphoribosyl-ATP diphosphatase [Listeria seeligeri]|uniref:phosphoribosyl-ATP diphosphatase n=1 Tax=Listeria seeligeri TaxID=1640 RepID=UPI0022EBBF29|nr:phosphoribosyl-ATP diphosphatase [Listeria seeligeri]